MEITDSVWEVLRPLTSYQRLPEGQTELSYSRDDDRKPPDKSRGDISEFQTPTPFWAKATQILFLGLSKSWNALMTLPRSIPGTCVSSIQSVLINHEPHFNFGSVFLDCVLLNCLDFTKFLLSKTQIVQNWKEILQIGLHTYFWTALD